MKYKRLSNKNLMEISDKETTNGYSANLIRIEECVNRIKHQKKLIDSLPIDKYMKAVMIKAIEKSWKGRIEDI